MSVIQLDPKHCIGEAFADYTFKLNYALFGHISSLGRLVNISGCPFSIIKSDVQNVLMACNLALQRSIYQVLTFTRSPPD